MSDITYQQLSDELPAGSVTLNAGVVSININAITGDAALTLSDGIAEGLHKLLVGAQKAQTTYNADVNNAVDLTSYPPVFTAGLTTVDGVDGVTYTHTVRTRAAISTDSLVATT